ncbi:MAG: hypothetical protein KAI33_03310 [Elusimicrobiales bacterium]|nr:hypothetical protein [Elusimicrobiales bacterium]
MTTTSSIIAYRPQEYAHSSFLVSLKNQSAKWLINFVTEPYCIVMVSFPRIKNNNQSLILFEGIKHSGYKKFEKRIHELSQETHFKELAKMCHSSSLIASRKFYYVKKAMIFLFSSIIPWVLLIYTTCDIMKITDLLKR